MYLDLKNKKNNTTKAFINLISTKKVQLILALFFKILYFNCDNIGFLNYIK